MSRAAPATKMKTFKRSRTFDEVIAQCKAQGVPVNIRAYVDHGWDTIVVGQPFPLRPEKAHAIYNTFNGTFWGVTPEGVAFDSNETEHEHEPWFQALLAFFMTNEDRPS